MTLLGVCDYYFLLVGRKDNDKISNNKEKMKKNVKYMIKKYIRHQYNRLH